MWAYERLLQYCRSFHLGNQSWRRINAPPLCSTYPLNGWAVIWERSEWRKTGSVNSASLLTPEVRVDNGIKFDKIRDRRQIVKGRVLEVSLQSRAKLSSIVSCLFIAGRAVLENRSVLWHDSFSTIKADFSAVKDVFWRAFKTDT